MNTRERIIDVAADLFSRHGFDGVSVRDIVARAQVNLGAITYHFGGKESLFGEVVKALVEPLRARGEEIAKSDLQPDRKLAAMLQAYADYILREQPSLRLLFSEMLLGGTRLPCAAVEGIECRNRLFAEVVEDGIQQGIFRPCDVECAAWNFFGMLSAYILYHPMQPAGDGSYPRATVQRVVQSALDIFLGGLMARPTDVVRTEKRDG